MPTRALVLVLLAATLLALALWPSPAGAAGTYHVYSCRLPDGSPAPTRAWKPFASELTTTGLRFDVSDRCGARGSMSVRSPTQGLAGSGAGWAFVAPPGTSITGWEIRRVARPSTGFAPPQFRYTSWSRAWPPGTGAGPLPINATEEGCWNPCQVLGGGPADAVYARTGVRLARLTLGLFCDAGCTANSDLGQLEITSAKVTLRDDRAPSLAKPVGGTLAGGGELTGVASVAATGSDAGSGVSSAALVLDGREVSRHDATCPKPYVDAVPCPRSLSVSLPVDTAQLAPGAHRAAVVFTDGAGNRSTEAAFGFLVASRVQPAPPRTEVIGPARIRAWFKGRSRATQRTLRFGERAVIEGTLTDLAGRPLAAALVQPAERTIGRAGAARSLAAVRTDRDGRFSYRLPPGANRVVELSHGLATARLTVRVRAGVTLKTSAKRVRNGSALRFTGRVRGEPGTRRALVTIYALSGGERKRIPVETVRARSNGRFHYTYRFARIPAPSVYRFEARVLEQTGFPYREGASRRVTVRGRP